MTRSWRMLLLAAALLAGALFVVACGGGNGNGDGDGDDTTETEVSDGDGQPADDGDDGDGDLLSIAEEFGEVEAKVMYRMSGEGIGDEDTMTLYWKPGVGWRVDFSSEGEEGSLIVQPDASYICSVDGGEGQCLQSPLTEAFPVPFLSSLTDPDAFATEIAAEFAGLDPDRSSRSIAGVDADCFSLSGEIEGESGEAEYCFGDGILVYLSGSSEEGGDFTMEATEVERSVPDSDLEPPYPVSEIPGLEDIDIDDIIEGVATP